MIRSDLRHPATGLSRACTVDAGEHVHGSGVDPQCLGVLRGNVCRVAVLDRPGGTTGRGQGWEAAKPSLDGGGAGCRTGVVSDLRAGQLGIPQG
jgi:hypothetical protein